jgi:hypothetical protein
VLPGLLELPRDPTRPVLAANDPLLPAISLSLIRVTWFVVSPFALMGLAFLKSAGAGTAVSPSGQGHT